MIRRVADIGTLNDPWGLAIAPSTFGQFAGDLLVGNFGNGTIDAFNLATDTLLGTLDDAYGTAIMLPALWDLTVGKVPAPEVRTTSISRLELAPGRDCSANSTRSRNRLR